MKKELIANRIAQLHQDTLPKFGIMTAQHMVEHLSITVKISHEKIKIPGYEPNEKQLKQKQALIYSNIEFPKGIKAPGLEDKLLELRFSNIEAAKQDLLKSIDEYNTYFQTNPSNLTLHPRLGKLTYEEWEKFHQKHFEHHLSQFYL